ncbi:MAG: hypothetical protein N3B16_12770, partial [Candidatus Aminicenantes bacterium]|nr:hypothetical protein [Candidatus Aminicenantes bacterium]
CIRDRDCDGLAGWCFDLPAKVGIGPLNKKGLRLKKPCGIGFSTIRPNSRSMPFLLTGLISGWQRLGL